MTSHDPDRGFDLEHSLQALFGEAGLRLLPDSCHVSCVVERGASIAGLWARCRAVIPTLPAGAGITVVILANETGMARAVRWLLVRVQLAVAVRAIACTDGTVLGQFAVIPDLMRRTLVYHLHTPAQHYAEHLLIPPAPIGRVARAVRSSLAWWAGCDTSAGAFVIVGRRR